MEPIGKGDRFSTESEWKIKKKKSHAILGRFRSRRRYRNPRFYFQTEKGESESRARPIKSAALIDQSASRRCQEMAPFSEKKNFFSNNIQKETDNELDQSNLAGEADDQSASR